MTGREIKGLIALQSAYNELNRNINRIIALRPELFTQQRIDKFDHWHEQILKHNLMYEEFRNALYHLFLLVLKLLDSTLTMYSRTFKNSYSRKYRKRVNRLLDEYVLIDFVIILTKDLNSELNKKFGYFEVEVAVAHNVNNIEVSPYHSNNSIEVSPYHSNINSLPMAVQVPNRMASAIGRELPFANSYVLGNANVNRNLNGSTNRTQSRRNGNTNLNRSMNRTQSRRNGMGNIYNRSLNLSLNVNSRRRNRNTLSNRSMNRRQTLRLNRMGNDPENTSLNSPQGISI